MKYLIDLRQAEVFLPLLNFSDDSKRYPGLFSKFYLGKT